VVLHVHLFEASITGNKGEGQFGRVENTRTPVLADTIRGPDRLFVAFITSPCGYGR
jgi:hypothetical protein